MVDDRRALALVPPELERAEEISDDEDAHWSQRNETKGAGNPAAWVGSRRDEERRVMKDGRRLAILVTSPPGQPSVTELTREALAGERPRKDYVELARLLDAVVVDSHYMRERATPAARLVARRLGLAQGQIAEAFVRRDRFAGIVAWADRLGLPLALLFKLARSRRDVVLIAHVLSTPKKAVFLKALKVHSHLGAIVGRSLQVEIAAHRLGVPREKLHVEPQPVDERFWRPDGRQAENLACAIGSESRDYATLIEAVRGVAIDLEVAVGSVGAAPDATGALIPDFARRAAPTGLPPNVRFSSPSLAELRELYARSRFVVVPVADVEYDAGSTVLTEAMAMGKAVIATRTPGITHFFEDAVQGLFVPPGDVGAMRAAIQRLRENPDEARRMGEAGRALVEERHSLDKCMARLAEIIENTLAE